MASASASAASLLFLHPQLRLCERVADHTDGGLQGGAAERARGAGYVATGLLKRGELLVEAEGWAFGAGRLGEAVEKHGGNGWMCACLSAIRMPLFGAFNFYTVCRKKQ